MDQSESESEVNEGGESVRKRKNTFSEYEVELLLELIKSRKLTVESKETDFGSIDKKSKCWGQITSEFNADDKVKSKSTKALRKKWDNMKSRAKKDVTTHKRLTKKTGGGPAPKPVADLTLKVQAVIPAQMTSLKNAFDGDAESDGEEETTLVIEKPHTIPTPIDPEEPTTDSNPSKSSKKKQGSSTSDPRSSLVNWEYEEHKLRLEILKTDLLYSKERLKRAIADTTFAEEEHVWKRQNLFKDE